MAAAFNEIGVDCVSAVLVESADVEKLIEHKIVKANDGGFSTGKGFDPMFNFSVKGRGSANENILGTASGSYIPDQISSGKIIITNVKNSQTNEDFDSFEVSGVAYPAAGGA